MSIVKFQNYSAIKNEQHTPRAVAGTDMKNGYAVVIKYVDGKETATVPTAEEAKGDIYFVWNTITTPELDNYDDFVIKKGKPVRAFNFANSVREIVEISGDLVTGTLIAIGDSLVANTTGGYVKATDVSGYKVSLKIIDTNTVGGSGFDCVIETREPSTGTTSSGSN